MFNVSELILELTGEKASGILIKKPSNLFYITNFSGEGFAYFTDKGEIILYVDGRYSERASKECFKGVKIVKLKEIYKDISSDILTRNASAEDVNGVAQTAVMFESDYMTYGEYTAFNTALNAKFKNRVKLIPASGALAKIRSIKDGKELNFIVEAVNAAEKSMLSALRNLKNTVFTEKDLAFAYKKNLLENNAGESFETITLSGKNSSLPHGAPSDKKIGKNSVLLCDFGAEINGYKSDETFTVHFGKHDVRFVDVYDTVYGAQQKAISAIKPGVKFSILDKIARDYIDKRGYGKYFTHSLGHGVGLDIHEYPYINKKNGDTVKEGMVFTVEPGVYIEGEFGVRIEDMCYVEKEGARIITGIKKNKCGIEDLNL
jgi:Xaa-Pro aminopeptidase